jgi:hypothetical protein
MSINKINNIIYTDLGKFKGVTKANLGKFKNVSKPFTYGATGPSPYSKSLHLDSSDWFKIYGNNQAGSGGYQNTRAETAFWRDVIVDNTTAFSFDIEFRPQTDGGTLFITDWGNYNASTNGGIRIQASAWGTTGAYVIIKWNRRSTGGDGYGGYLQRYYWFNTAATGMGAGHFTDAQTRGFWHKVTVTKTTGTSFKDDVKVYFNGAEPASVTTSHSAGSQAWDADETIPNDATYVDSDNNQGFTWITMPSQFSDSNFGSMSFYDKALSLEEVNDLYDGGARAGGSADQTKILNIDPTNSDASTRNNLVHYFYYNSSVDSSGGSLIIDKISGGVDPEMKLNSGTVGGVSENTVPQINRFDPTVPPVASYAGETITLNQASGSGGPVTWYSDSGRSSLVNTGTSYSLTAPAAGSHTLYTRDTHSSGVTQDGTFPYTTYASAGHLDYAYNFGYNNGELGHQQMASTGGGYFDSSDFAADGSFAITMWYTTDSSLVYNGHIFWLLGDTSWLGRVDLHLNASYPWIKVRLNGTWYTLQFDQHGTWGGNVPGWAHDSWRCLVFSHDVTAGTFTAWSNGEKLGSFTSSNYEVPIIKASTDDTAWIYASSNMGKIANYAVYGDHLTDAEGVAICGSSNTPGNSVDLESLSGSSSKLVEYWKFAEAHDNDTADRLTGEIDSGHYFALTSASSNNSARRTNDRP